MVINILTLVAAAEKQGIYRIRVSSMRANRSMFVHSAKTFNITVGSGSDKIVPDDHIAPTRTTSHCNHASDVYLDLRHTVAGCTTSSQLHINDNHPSSPGTTGT